MATGERARVALETLKAKALSGSPSEVEIALGRFRGDTAISAAEEAAQSALGARKWANLAYLADFLADVTAPHLPEGGDASGGDGNASRDDGNARGGDGNASGDDGNASGDDGNASGDVEPIPNILALMSSGESALADKVLALYTVDLDDTAAKV